MRRFETTALSITTLLTAALLTVSSITTAHAGCGCDKPPPPASQLLPSVAPAGTAVRILHSTLVTGRQYRVRFTSAAGTAADAQGTVAVRRDMADGKAKPQLVVTLPALPLGPAKLAVYDTTNGRLVTNIADSQFTVAPTPVALPTSYGAATYPGYQAAVGRDGTVYVALDLTTIEMPMVFDAQLKQFPLRFTGSDLAFYNTQGYLMQLLEERSEPVPGMFVFPAGATSPDSDIVHYSRHEFVTYVLQHDERLPHAVDATDANWHEDGSPHIDHDHLILAIYGTVKGALPRPGATQAFDLVVTTHSLFSEGLVGTSSVTVGKGGVVDSYAPLLGANGILSGVLMSTSLVGRNGLTAAGGTLATGDVFSAGSLSVQDRATVDGDVTGKTLSIAPGANVTGDQYKLVSNPTFMSIKMPPGIATIPPIDMSLGLRTISGPGSFRVSHIQLAGLAQLVIDNTRGPVTLYVDGPVSIANLASVLVLNRDPEQFAIYVTGTSPVSLTGKLLSSFYGVVYAPTSTVTIAQGASFFGAFVGKSVTSTGTVHYYSPLRSPSAAIATTRS